MGKNNVKGLVGFILAIAAGGLAVFLMVMNAVFSYPGSRLSEKLLYLLMVGITYSVMGFIFGRLGKETSWWWGIYISLPAVSFLLVYMFAEAGVLFISLVYLVLTVAFAVLGAYLGSKINFKPVKKSGTNPVDVHNLGKGLKNDDPGKCENSDKEL
jgi:membrane-associated HD superfamily phosphohydrolase